MLAFAACAPVVAHGPRVQPGAQAVLTTGMARSLCDSGCQVDVIPQVAAGLSRGWAATETRPGVSLGGKLAFLSPEFDGYVQAPTGWTRTLDAGAGVVVGAEHTMPYLQLGRMRADGSGWYTTQGFVWGARREARQFRYRDPDRDEEGPELAAPRYWSPTLAVRTAGRDGVHLYLSGAFGWAKTWDWDYDVDQAPRPAGRQPVRALILGVVFEREAPRLGGRAADPPLSSTSH